MISWSLCIATLNRKDILARAIELALEQTWMPSQIVIVDASDDWQASKKQVENLVSKHKNVQLDYFPAPEKSSATQRNFGISKCTSDILFMLDDDSFMFNDCAETIMQVYEADTAKAVAGISAVAVPALPKETIKAIEQKQTGRFDTSSLFAPFMKSKFGKWVNRKILFQNTEELFIKYDGNRQSEVPSNLAHFDLRPVTFLGGCTMTVRREVAEKELFDSSLRYYAAFEDLDASYRYAQHGQLVLKRGARIHHYEAASGRIKRRKVIIFQLMNLIVFIKRNASNPDAWKSTYRFMLARRLFGETIKDLLSGRFSFPQASAVLFAMRNWKSAWQVDTSDLDTWYPKFQKRILDDLD